jgi:hypothetical protein
MSNTWIDPKLASTFRITFDTSTIYIQWAIWITHEMILTFHSPLVRHWHPTKERRQRPGQVLLKSNTSLSSIQGVTLSSLRHVRLRPHPPLNILMLSREICPRQCWSSSVCKPFSSWSTLIIPSSDITCQHTQKTWDIRHPSKPWLKLRRIFSTITHAKLFLLLRTLELALTTALGGPKRQLHIFFLINSWNPS